MNTYLELLRLPAHYPAEAVPVFAFGHDTTNLLLAHVIRDLIENFKPDAAVRIDGSMAYVNAESKHTPSASILIDYTGSKLCGWDRRVGEDPLLGTVFSRPCCNVSWDTNTTILRISPTPVGESETGSISPIEGVKWVSLGHTTYDISDPSFTILAVRNDIAMAVDAHSAVVPYIKAADIAAMWS